MRRIVMTVVACVALGTAAGATVTVPMDFRAIVTSSDVIVRGHVTDIRTTSAADRTQIESIATVAVESALKGTSDDFVYVHVPGGQIGRLKVVAVDAPTFAIGDRAMFFLGRGPDNYLRPVGLSLGIYRIATDSRTGQTSIAPPLLAGQTAAIGPVVHGDPARQMMGVDEFQSLVRLVLAAPGVGASRR